MTKILGLTGGIASGKTTISNYFKSKNIPVIDADLIAHDIMRAGTPVVKKIGEIFGQEVILSNGEINRKKLGEIVFSSSEKREKLNQIVQGTIRKKLINQRDLLLQQNHKLIVLDIPLLYEENFEQNVDEVMVVYVDQKTQKQRLLKRNPDLSPADAKNRINAQFPLEDKAQKADIVIDNTNSQSNSFKQVDDWLKNNF